MKTGGQIRLAYGSEEEKGEAIGAVKEKETVRI